MKNWLNHKTVEKEIQGHTVKFRRIPIGILQKCRGLNEDVSKALAMVLKDTSHDIEVESITNESGATSFTHSAAQASIISMRKIQMEEGIKGILEAITKDTTLEIVSEIIVASAYEEFSESDVKSLKDNMDAVTMFEFLRGAFEASAGDYASLGKSLFQKNQKVQDIVEKVKEAAPMT